MCKRCVLTKQNPRKTLCLITYLYPSIFYNINNTCITISFTQLYKLLRSLVVNIKNSLSISIKGKLSTVSTHPTIKIVILKFNEFIIIKKVGTTP